MNPVRTAPVGITNRNETVKLTVRLPDSLRLAFKALAIERRVSLQDLAAEAIGSMLSEHSLTCTSSIDEMRMALRSLDDALCVLAEVRRLADKWLAEATSRPFKPHGAIVDCARELMELTEGIGD